MTTDIDPTETHDHAGAVKTAFMADLAVTAPKVPVLSDSKKTVRTADNKVVIDGPFPYAVWRTAPGDDDKPRLSGHKTRLSIPFWLTTVGETEDQALKAAGYLRFRLKDRRIAVPGYTVGLVRVEESQRIWRDDESVNPSGHSLFYGVDSYAVTVNIIEFMRSTA